MSGYMFRIQANWWKSIKTLINEVLKSELFCCVHYIYFVDIVFELSLCHIELHRWTKHLSFFRKYIVPIWNNSKAEMEKIVVLTMFSGSFRLIEGSQFFLGWISFKRWFSNVFLCFIKSPLTLSLVTN